MEIGGDIMKRVITIIIIAMLLLMGCGAIENEAIINQQKHGVSANDYKAKIQKLTDKEIYKMIIEDFDQNGKKEAFVLTKDNKEGDENEFELWFLNLENDEKLIDSFIASDNTSVELLNNNNKYILFNKCQIRQNDEMKFVIYGVKDNKAIELFSQKKLNLFIEKDELYAFNYSYSVLEPEFKEWMSLSEQKYHFKWDEDNEICKEYRANIISEDKFMDISQSKEVKEKVYQEIKSKCLGKIKDMEYTYLVREDETLDINIIVTIKGGSKYKYCATVLCKDNTLGTDIELFEGNKEESIVQYLNQ